MIDTLIILSVSVLLTSIQIGIVVYILGFIVVAVEKTFEVGYRNIIKNGIKEAFHLKWVKVYKPALGWPKTAYRKLKG